jgi:hypothetical protein
MVNAEIKAKTKIINANFFHIKEPSFRIYLSFINFLDGGGREFIQIEIFPDKG